MKRLPGILDYRHARSMYGITLDLEIEGKDEHLDFQLCVPFISSHCQAVSLMPPLRHFEIIASALNAREITYLRLA